MFTYAAAAGTQEANCRSFGKATKLIRERAKIKHFLSDCQENQDLPYRFADTSGHPYATGKYLHSRPLS